MSFRMWRCLLGAAFLVLLTSCIQVHISGTSDRQYKKAALASPLISLSDQYYPGDTPQTTEGIVKSLPADQVAKIQRDLRSSLDGLKKAHTTLLKYLENELGVSMPATMPINLEIERAGEVTEEIRSDNTIYIDLEVLQAFFKTSIIDVSRDADPHGGGVFFSRATSTADAPSAANEDKIVQDFIEFKRNLRKSKGRTIIGEALHGDEESNLDNMFAAMNRATSRYYGLLLFTIAHEMGHYALGHLKEKCDSSNCPRFAERELAADRYAAALMSALVPELPGLLAGLDFYDTRQELRGYEAFFQIGYKLARFSGMSGCSCPYPPPDERMRLAKVEQESATKRLYEEGWIRMIEKPAKTSER